MVRRLRGRNKGAEQPQNNSNCNRRLLVRLVLLTLAVLVVVTSLVGEHQWLDVIKFQSSVQGILGDIMNQNEEDTKDINPGALSQVISHAKLEEESHNSSTSNTTQSSQDSTANPQQIPPIPALLDPPDLAEWDDFRHEYRLQRTVETPNVAGSDMLCVPWEINGDDWWTHHRDWEEAPQGDNETHYCFQKISSPEKAFYFRNLYHIQFPIDPLHCNDLMVKQMWNSGWGADMMNLVDGLHHAYQTKRPVQIQESLPWHYALPKRSVVSKSKPVKAACPLQNMYCYLLNMSSCHATTTNNNQTGTTTITEPAPFWEDMPSLESTQYYRWYIEWLVRPQTWLRKRVFDFVQQRAPPMETPCSVMHVRRNDVVLHYSQARKFHPISEYINATQGSIRPNILLLTDDHHAIGEAMTQYPDHHWMYIDRPRFRGVGGWEHQIPSDDPVFEVVVLFAMFRMVRQCDQIILSTGKLSSYLYEEMKRGRPSDTAAESVIDKVDIDNLQQQTIVLNAANAITHTVSKNYEQSQQRETSITSGGKQFVNRQPLSRDKEFEGSFCLPWDVDMDEWWTHHPTWEAEADTNTTHQCFQPIANAKKAKLFQDLYQIQFWDGDCQNVLTKRMWSSGWGADFENVVDGLLHAKNTGIPFQVAPDRWHYADNSVKQEQTKGTVKIACPRRNMFCYFLEISRCLPKEKSKEDFLEPESKGLDEFPWLTEYATRQQTWLRKQVSDFVHKQLDEGFVAPCTAIHVRRGDIIDHDEQSRKYHAIEEYLEYAKQKGMIVHQNIFILTDDANAIPEAKTKYPQYNWMYIDRPRKHSDEAKWEQHLASNDPIFEMVVLQSIFQLVGRCDQLIHSQSQFGVHLGWEMKATGRPVTILNIDEGKEAEEIYSANNKATKTLSKSFSGA